MPIVTIDVKNDYGDIVYLVTDKDQSPRVIAGYKVRRGETLYILAHYNQESEHYDFEFTDEKNVILTTT